jgi:hypothetical protein
MPRLYRVAWDTAYTKRTCAHDAEELDAAQAHLSLLRDRHPIVEYRLVQVDAPPDAAPAEPDHGQAGLEQASRR